MGLRQVFIKPTCPWQNGKVERFHRTLQTEWAYRQVFVSNTDCTTALAPSSSSTTLNYAAAQ
jgi:transposase InsO family protein